MDIAQLGFSVNATAIEAATKSLNEMTAAAARAEKASKMGSARGSDRVTERAERQAASVRKVSRAYDSVGVSGRRAMTTIAASTRKTAAEVGFLRSQLRGIGEVFKHAIGGLIAFGAVAAMAEFARSIGDANVQMQRILFTLDAATGTMQKARQAFAFVAKQSSELGLNLQETAQGYARLAASALGADISTDKLRKGFRALAGAFTVLHAPAQEVQRVLVQLDQGFSLGRIQMRDLRAISNSMPAVLEMVSEGLAKMGKNMGDLLAHGGIPAKLFFEVFTSQLQNKFGPAVKEASNSLDSWLNRLHNVMFKIKTDPEIVDTLRDAIKGLVQTLKQPGIKEGIESAVKGLVDGFKTAIAVVTKLLHLMPELIAALKVLIVIFGSRLAVEALGAFGGAVTRVTGKLTLASRVIRRYGVAAGSAAIATKGLSAAMAFLGGPVGIAIIAAFTAYKLFTDALQKNLDKLKAHAAALRDEADALRKNNKLLREYLGNRESLASVVSSMPSATATVTAANANIAQSWLMRAKAAQTALQAELGAMGKQAIDAAQRLDARAAGVDVNVPGTSAADDKAIFMRYRDAVVQNMKLKEQIAAQIKAFGTGEFAQLVTGLTQQAGLTDKVAKYHATVEKLQATMAEAIKNGMDPARAKKLEALGEKAARAIMNAGNHSGGSQQTAADRLLQSITERTQAQALLQAELKKSKGAVDSLLPAQKMLIKFNVDVANGYIKVSDSEKEAIRTGLERLVNLQKQTEAMKANYKALQDQAEALEKVNKIGSVASSKASALTAQAASLLPGSVFATQRGTSKAAGMRGRLIAERGQLADTKQATDAYNSAKASVAKYADALDNLAVAKKAVAAVQQFEDSRDPNAQYERNIHFVQSYLKFLRQLTKEQLKAFDPKQLAAYHKALDVLPKTLKEMKTQLAGIKLETAAQNVAAGLQSLQSLSEQGSKSYKEMQVAIDAANIAAAIGAILNQGMGDPYTAFARMAAMAALVAGMVGDIGAVGNSGFTDTAKQRQETQGTGSVLGDATKQSQSIANAAKMTADATSKLVGINTGMLHAIQQLQAGIGSASGMLARGAGDINFSQSALSVGKVGWINTLQQFDPFNSWDDVLGIFGGKSKVTDQGIKIMGGAITDMINNIAIGAYEEVQSKSWAFGSTHTREGFKKLTGSLSNQFQLIFQSIVNTVTEASKAIGLPLDDIQRKIAAFNVATQHISLKGLDAEEKQKALEAVFSKIFDNLAAAVVPFVKEFQKVGEGMAETLVRVATDVQIMQRAVKTLGFAIRTSDPKKFAEVSVALVNLMGGADKFIQGMNTFISDFAPDAVKLKQAHDQLTAALKQVGLALPDTRTGMWKLMQSLDATTDSGRQQIAVLLQLADVSDQYYSMLENGVDTIADAAQKLADALYGSLGSSLDAITKKLDELKGKTQSALGVALGANSPLSAQEQLNLALKGLHSGLTTVSQVLQIGKQLYRGADYRKLYEQVMAGQGMGAGGVGDIGAAVDQYNSLYAKQQQLQKQQDAMDRFNNAKQLASYVVQMAQNQGESYKDVASGLGFSLNSLGKDLGVTSIIGYLDKLRLEGAGTGKEQVAVLNKINGTNNEQVTLLKSIDQRLRDIENGTSATATNTGKQVQNSNRQSLRQTAAGSRTVPA